LKMSLESSPGSDHVRSVGSESSRYGTGCISGCTSRPSAWCVRVCVCVHVCTCVCCGVMRGLKRVLPSNAGHTVGRLLLPALCVGPTLRVRASPPTLSAAGAWCVVVREDGSSADMSTGSVRRATTAGRMQARSFSAWGRGVCVCVCVCVCVSEGRAATPRVGGLRCGVRVGLTYTCVVV
jgi:hypothetical protein